MKTLPVVILCTAAGLAGGYFWGQDRGAAHARAESERRAAAELAEAVSRASAAGEKKGRAAITGVPVPSGFENVDLNGIFGKPGPLDRFQAIFAFVNGLPADRLTTEIMNVRDQLMAGNFDPDRMLAIHLLMTRFGMENPEKAQEWLSHQDVMTRGFGTVTVLASLASKDPTAAAKMFADPENPITRIPQVGSFAAMGLAREWARNDPAGALEWAKSLPEEQQAGAMTGAVGSVLAEDPAAAARMAAGLPEGEARSKVAGNVAENWATLDPAAALAWAGTLEGSDQSEAMRKVMSGWAARDPAAAAEHIAQLPEDQQGDYVSSVAGRWAVQDPAQAAAWVAQQPEGEGRKDGIGSVMGTWVETDPQAASAWLVDQPAGPSKDQGIQSLANSQIRSDPESALTWAATIADPLTREQQLRSNVKAWRKRDEAAATEWIQTSPGLTEEDRAVLSRP